MGGYDKCVVVGFYGHPDHEAIAAKAPEMIAKIVVMNYWTGPVHKSVSHK